MEPWGQGGMDCRRLPPRRRCPCARSRLLASGARWEWPCVIAALKRLQSSEPRNCFAGVEDNAVVADGLSSELALRNHQCPDMGAVKPCDLEQDQQDVRGYEITSLVFTTSWGNCV
ncbi:hypothetical protein Mp_8g14570 [Marchantia polymorpha subsp. ruderalis]|uniref:Uncharacterized protein n=1 Tax=Marchantia polymorpha TaxID=3197 RepID=A0A2R6VXE7_MARPO|nr:hypothetical protein MARPO_3498s0001 [Marchantia polymorpha]BBN19885.1 hypothetical protein Mp_8g14570 [Marchantia polymorpha subsp. ruderalis]|eukprot:PTQ26279.1 hypothetical protein MARPO_3498s0001 [Marchantia polymorpha]